MRRILTAPLCLLLLTGCMAQWKGVNHPDRRTALEGQPGMSCAPARQRPGMRTKDEPLCMTKAQWAEYDKRQRIAGMNSPAALYPNGTMAPVAPDGNPPPGPAWNPN